MVETDGDGRYRLASRQIGIGIVTKKFIAPHLREILEHSGRKIDLSRYV